MSNEEEGVAAVPVTGFACDLTLQYHLLRDSSGTPEVGGQYSASLQSCHAFSGKVEV